MYQFVVKLFRPTVPKKKWRLDESREMPLHLVRFNPVLLPQSLPGNCCCGMHSPRVS